MQPAFVSIRTIQATKPSAYATQAVTTSGIVVGVKSNGFYLEAKDADTTPVTPEGILVYTGSTTLPSFIALGAEVQVTGTVNTYPTTSSTPGTEIDAPETFTLLTKRATRFQRRLRSRRRWTRRTGGIKQFAKLKRNAGGDWIVDDDQRHGRKSYEATETNVSNGVFYGVVTGVARPFREPGLSLLEAAFPTGTVTCSSSVTTNCVPVWDANPELIAIDKQGVRRADDRPDQQYDVDGDRGCDGLLVRHGGGDPGCGDLARR